MPRQQKGKGKSHQRTSRTANEQEKEFKRKRDDNRKDMEIPDKNDYKFYAPNDQIAKDIASVPFNQLVGGPLSLQAGVVTPTTSGIVVEDLTDGGKSTVVSVMRLDYIPAIGICTERTDNVNMAAVQLYTAIRKVNSGAKNYEAADIMMYVLAMRDIYGVIAKCKAALGMVPQYAFLNHNLPDLVLRAMEVDPVDLRSNYAAYRGKLNLLIAKANSFAVPSFFSAFERESYINGYVFTDSDSIRGQMYLFSRQGYYTWEPIASETGSSLTFHMLPVGTPKNPVLFQVYLDALSDMIDAIFLDEDALTMSGDILKYSESNVYQVSLIDENYVTPFKMDEDILSQIENSTGVCAQEGFYRAAVEAAATDGTLNVTQSNQLIRWAPEFKNTNESDEFASIRLSGLILNSHKESPDYTNVLEWTRNMSTWEDVWNEGTTGSTTGVIRKITSCGLELITTYTAFFPNFNSTVHGKVWWAGIMNVAQFATNFRSTTSTWYDGNVATWMYLSQFDWHPIMYYASTKANADNGVSVYNNAGTTQSQIDQLVVGGDLKVYTVLNTDTLININKMATYGAFYKKG